MRIETDSIGSMTLPDEAYYGIQTARALQNFSISGIALSAYPEFVDALVTVKQAAALMNRNSVCWINDDTYPTAIEIALQVQITRLHATLMDLVSVFRATASDLVEATQDVGAFVQVSGVLKGTALGREMIDDPVMG